MTNSNLARIAVVRTGGTIDSIGVDRLDLAWYSENSQRLGPGELIGRVPELARVADVQEVAASLKASIDMSPTDWLQLLGRLHELLGGEFDGAVVTHGTAVLEETAYFLHLTLRTPKPVVLTGSMRPASAMSSDGDLNLLNAVRVAADPASHGRGVLVVLNDTIHSGREVTKTNTSRVQTFESRDAGPLGYADKDGRVVWYRLPIRKHTTATEFDVRQLEELPRVDIVLSYAGADGSAIDAAVAAGCQGIVIAGSGSGRRTVAQDESLARAQASGVVVCYASRVGSGRVVRSPQQALRAIVAAEDLVPWKARILLMLALTRTRDVEAIQRMFEEY